MESKLSDVQVGSEVVFSDIDESGKLVECIGLKHFVRTIWRWIPTVVFDNHNHAFYFWYEARKNKIIEDGATLIHIDEHSDLGIPEDFTFDRENLTDVFRYTNEVLQVGNYIRPAEKDGLIWKTHIILSEWALQEYEQISLSDNLILNLDLDFFEPRLDDISFELKKKAILYFASHAKLITIATSPFFINQELAIRVLHQLFDD